MHRADAILAVQRAVEVHRAAMEQMVSMSRDEATNAETRPENKYDTRATDASYLAAGQGQRLIELTQLSDWVARLDPTAAPAATVAVGSILGMGSNGRVRWVLLAPMVGPTLQVCDAELSVISTVSPLGRALLGLEAGDTTEVRGQEVTLHTVA